MKNIVNSSEEAEPLSDSSIQTSEPTKWVAAFSWMAVGADISLISTVGWFTSFIAGAAIDKGTVYTGPVGAVFAAYIALSLVLSMVSTIFSFGVRRHSVKGSLERARAWYMWLGAHAFFIIATIANCIFVSIQIR